MKATIKFLTVILFAAATSCSTGKGDVPVSMVTLDNTVLNISLYGSPVRLNATVFPPDASNKAVSWHSGNTSTATVSDGLVTPVAVGSTMISAVSDDGGKTAKCRVNVYAASVIPDLVSTDRSEMTLYSKGGIGVIKVTVLPADSDDKSVEWTSSDKSVATVDRGMVTPLSPGFAEITAAAVCGGASGVCRITVLDAGAAPVHPTGVSIDKTSLTVAAGGYAKLISTVIPANALDKDIMWSSDNTDIADVGEGGLVTALAEGTATITAKTADGGFTANCIVTVTG